MFAFFKRKEPAPKPQEIKSIGHFLKHCDAAKAVVVFSPDRSNRRVSLPYPNIQEWNLYLRRVVDKIRSNELPPTYWGDSMPQSRYLRDFFVDKDNFYLDAVDQMGRLLTYATEICAYVDTLEKSNDSVATQKRIRALSMNVTQLKDFIEVCGISQEPVRVIPSAIRAV